MTHPEELAVGGTPRPGQPASFLLVGPYDPACGEYTFLAPPLGVWRLAGVLEHHGFAVEVFDPNHCPGESPRAALERALQRRPPDVIGFSTTAMTLPHDLSLAHAARRARPSALLVAGGIEATFRPADLLRLGPFDLCVLGEGERPLVEIGRRLRAGAALDGIAGTARAAADGALDLRPQPALGRSELVEAVFHTPYERMPYRGYWQRLEQRCRVGDLPHKADREARLAEIRSVRLITLNYCPMGCTFCSSTNFLGAAAAATARVARLDAGECLQMIRRLVGCFPDLRTVIFQDDIFVFTADDRILPLCQGIVEAKARGEIPPDLQFISTNRIDAMRRERLEAMRAAGFRVLGFGIESFSPRVLAEFNKAAIVPHVRPVLAAALELGITPFLDLILSSPRSRVEDLAINVREALAWLDAGCEIGIYPYVIPFTGAALAADPTLRPHTIHVRRQVAGTAVSWEQPAKIPPLDPAARDAVLAIEERFEQRLAALTGRGVHLPSRVRSLLWIVSAIPVLERLGQAMPAPDRVLAQLARRLPAELAGARSLAVRAPIPAAQLG